MAERCFALQAKERFDNLTFEGRPLVRGTQGEKPTFDYARMDDWVRRRVEDNFYTSIIDTPAVAPSPIPPAPPAEAAPAITDANAITDAIDCSKRLREAAPRANHVLDWAQRMNAWAFDPMPEACTPRKPKRRTKCNARSQMTDQLRPHSHTHGTDINPRKAKPIHPFS